MTLIDQVNEINPAIEQHIASMFDPDNDFVIIGYLRQYLEKQGYYISTAIVFQDGEVCRIGDIANRKGDILFSTAEIEHITAIEIEQKLLLKSIELLTKNTTL